MRRLSRTQLSFIVAAAAIAAVGMFRDPDTANADEVSAAPVTHERMPGYQVIPNIPKYEPLTQAERAALNAPVDGTPPTF